MDTIIELIQKCDVANIIVMIAMFYWFNGCLDKKFDKVYEELKDIRSEIKDIRSDIKELRTSVNRMEGAIMSKDCCMLKDERQIKKVE